MLAGQVKNSDSSRKYHADSTQRLLPLRFSSNDRHRQCLSLSLLPLLNKLQPPRWQLQLFIVTLTTLTHLPSLHRLTSTHVHIANKLEHFSSQRAIVLVPVRTRESAQKQRVLDSHELDGLEQSNRSATRSRCQRHQRERTYERERAISQLPIAILTQSPIESNRIANGMECIDAGILMDIHRTEK